MIPVSGNSTEVETTDFSFYPTFTFPFTSFVSELLPHLNSVSAFVFIHGQGHTKKNKCGQIGDRVSKCSFAWDTPVLTLKVPRPRKPLSFGQTRRVILCGHLYMCFTMTK